MARNRPFERPPFLRQPADGVGLVRREMLRVGSAGLVGLSLPDLLKAAQPPKPDDSKTSTFAPKARNLILMFLEGGPPIRTPGT